MICEGGEAFFAFRCLHRFGIRPLEFLNMSSREKAFIIAAAYICDGKEVLK